MGQNEFREGKRIEDEEGNKDILLKELEMAHIRELEFGKFIMQTKGWAILILSAIITAYYTLLNRSMNFHTFLFFCTPFILLWVIEILMGAYQKPYYKAIIEIENELTMDKKERNLIPLTYKDEKKAYYTVFKNWIKCASPFSLNFIFYGSLIVLLGLLWLSSIDLVTPTDLRYSQKFVFTTSTISAVGIISVLINLATLYFNSRQVKAAEFEMQKSVVPILGITLERDNKGKFLNTLIIYVKNNIALDIDWKINKDGVLFDSDTRSVVVPKLRTDELLYIKTRSFNLLRGEKIEFKADFNYRSILREKNKHNIKYSLITWKDEKGIHKEENLESWKLPWDH